MGWIEIVGMAAGALTTASFIPQVIKTYRSKSAKDISTAMVVVLGAGVALWVVYGLYTGALPVLLANSCTLVLVATLLGLKIKYRG